jgi:predicted DNA-binding mobile mystery protein A
MIITMKTDLKDLAHRQVESLLAPWKQPLPKSPPKGWIKVLREGLGMPASYLARVMNVEQSTIKRYEEAEASAVISLKTLQKIADALDCELKYALVPKVPLAQMIEERAHQVAKERLKSVAHTMALEDQATKDGDRTALIAEQVKLLIGGSRRDLWR